MNWFTALKSRLFGSGDAVYDALFGILERRLLRRTLRAADPVRLAYYRGIAYGVREMNHLLFLFPSSPFQGRLDRVSPADAGGMVVSWAALVLAVLAADKRLPDPPDEAPEEIQAMLGSALPADVASFSQRLADYSTRLDQKELYGELLREVGRACGVEPDLEMTITFSLIVNRMLETSAARCRRLMPSPAQGTGRPTV